MIPTVKAKLLEGKQGLIVGIANEQSVAWGCAAAFRAFGAEIAVTYLNDKARKYVEPLARELEAPILMPLDVRVPGQMEAVFEQIGREWRRLDFLIHSIAFSPKDTLCGRVVDAPQDGVLTTMDISCWSFIRMAHLAEPLMTNGGSLFTMTYYGSQTSRPSRPPSSQQILGRRRTATAASFRGGSERAPEASRHWIPSAARSDRADALAASIRRAPRAARHRAAPCPLRGARRAKDIGSWRDRCRVRSCGQ